jgi:hypothetical protein
MNRELEALILAYEAVSESRDKEAERRNQNFEALLDKVLEGQPGLSRDTLRLVIIPGTSQMGAEASEQTVIHSPPGRDVRAAS